MHMPFEIRNISYLKEKAVLTLAAYTKIRTTQRLAPPLHEEDMQIHQMFHIFEK